MQQAYSIEGQNITLTLDDVGAGGLGGFSGQRTDPNDSWDGHGSSSRNKDRQEDKQLVKLEHLITYDRFPIKKQDFLVRLGSRTMNNNSPTHAGGEQIGLECPILMTDSHQWTQADETANSSQLVLTKENINPSGMKKRVTSTNMTFTAKPTGQPSKLTKATIQGADPKPKQ